MQKKTIWTARSFVSDLREGAAMLGFVLLFFTFWQFATAGRINMPERRRRDLKRLVFAGYVNLGIGVLIVLASHLRHDNLILLGLIGTASVHVLLGIRAVR